MSINNSDLPGSGEKPRPLISDCRLLPWRLQNGERSRALANACFKPSLRSRVLLFSTFLVRDGRFADQEAAVNFGLQSRRAVIIEASHQNGPSLICKIVCGLAQS